MLVPRHGHADNKCYVNIDHVRKCKGHIGIWLTGFGILTNDGWQTTTPSGVSVLES